MSPLRLNIRTPLRLTVSGSRGSARFTAFWTLTRLMSVSEPDSKVISRMYMPVLPLVLLK